MPCRVMSHQIMPCNVRSLASCHAMPSIYVYVYIYTCCVPSCQAILLHRLADCRSPISACTSCHAIWNHKLMYMYTCIDVCSCFVRVCRVRRSCSIGSWLVRSQPVSSPISMCYGLYTMSCHTESHMNTCIHARSCLLRECRVRRSCYIGSQPLGSQRVSSQRVRR